MTPFKRQLFLMAVMSLLFLGTTSIFYGPLPQLAIAQTPPDGLVECHNFVKNGKKANCICWGEWNPNNPSNPQCKPPAGEDPRCTNHCRKELCKCKPKSQS